MYIIPEATIYDPALLCQFIRDHAISHMTFTPSLLEAVLDLKGIDLAECLKEMRLGN